MADEKRRPKRSCHPRQKWLSAAAATLLLVLLAACFSTRYILFVSQTIYQESTTHLEEVLHKSNNMLQRDGAQKPDLSAFVQRLSGKCLGRGRNSNVH